MGRISSGLVIVLAALSVIGRAAPDRATELAYEVHLAQYPSDLRVRLEFGAWLRDAGRHAAAREQLLAASKLSPRNAQIHRDLAEIAADTGEPREAMNRSSRSLALNPRQPDLRFRLANWLLMEGEAARAVFGWDDRRRVREALAHFRAVKEADPQQLLYASAYAEAHYALQDPDWESAEQAWLQCLPLAKDPSGIYRHLVRVAELAGWPERAERYQLLARRSAEPTRLGMR